MLHGVVFDMDGVVIDSHPAHREAWKAFLADLGTTVADSELDIILDGGKREEILQHFLGDLSRQQILDYGKRKDEILRNRRTKLEPMPGVVEFLDQLCISGIRVALATSASKHRTLHTLEELRIAHFFETVVTGDDVAAGKPDPAVYHLAASRMQELPERLLAVEDAVSGVKAARSAGLRCAAIAHNGRADALQKAGANPIVEDFRSLSLRELQALFDEMSGPRNLGPR
jgi:HAD superfamily hydrolase (TIGR01509 family)